MTQVLVELDVVSELFCFFQMMANTWMEHLAPDTSFDSVGVTAPSHSQVFWKKLRFSQRHYEQPS